MEGVRIFTPEELANGQSVDGKKRFNNNNNIECLAVLIALFHFSIVVIWRSLHD